MKTPEFPDSLPVEVEEQLTHLLERWANNNRLSTARASAIREAVQEDDAWGQRFWTRMSTVWIDATAVVQHIPVQQWSLPLSLPMPIQTDLARISSQNSYNDPGYRPYLSLST